MFVCLDGESIENEGLKGKSLMFQEFKVILFCCSKLPGFLLVTLTLYKEHCPRIFFL